MFNDLWKRWDCFFLFLVAATSALALSNSPKNKTKKKAKKTHSHTVNFIIFWWYNKNNGGSRKLGEKELCEVSRVILRYFHSVNWGGRRRDKEEVRVNVWWSVEIKWKNKNLMKQILCWNFIFFFRLRVAVAFFAFMFVWFHLSSFSLAPIECENLK